MCNHNSAHSPLPNDAPPRPHDILEFNPLVYLSTHNNSFALE